jgi:hypothetical protein
MNDYLTNIMVEGGMGCEAVEIGLWHANNEIYKPDDGIPVSLIFVIGDAPANPNLEIVKLKRKYANTKTAKIDHYINQSLTDAQANQIFAINRFWTDKEVKIYGPPTTWER